MINAIAGDWLRFGWGATVHNVVEVTELAFIHCATMDITENELQGQTITTWGPTSIGGLVVVSLPSVGTQYFVSTGGQGEDCFSGEMRLQVTVAPAPATIATSTTASLTPAETVSTSANTDPSGTSSLCGVACV